MPEAVIVATARSPIGRAFKGSLTSIRPDDLTAQMVTAALAKVPQLDPTQINDLILGCGLPGGEQGYNMARVVAVMLGYDTVPGTTITRYCSSSLQSTRMAFHAIKAGEGDIYVSAGVECVSRFANGSSDGLPNTKNPVFADAEARAKEMEKGGFSLARPARGRPGTRHLHRHGPDRGERRPAARREPGRAGRVRRPVAEPGREGAGGRVLAARHHAGHDARRHRGLRRRRPAGRHHAGEGQPAAAGLPAGRDRDRGELLPAERRRRGRGRDERHQGGRAGHHPAGADRVQRRHRAVPRDHGPGPGRGVPAGPGPGGHDDRRRGPGRDQRGVRGPGDPVLPATSASTSTSSTSTAARSRSATRSA